MRGLKFGATTGTNDFLAPPVSKNENFPAAIAIQVHHWGYRSIKESANRRFSTRVFWSNPGHCELPASSCAPMQWPQLANPFLEPECRHPVVPLVPRRT